MPRKTIVVLLKGYPRLSETFIAQEMLGLEKVGFDLRIASMRRPTEKKHHPINDEIKAPVTYLPEYLHQEPIRVIKALLKVRRLPGFREALKAFRADLSRDVSRNRFRRFGQAAVLAAEWPADAGWLHAHFIHTPAAVARYAGMIAGIPWTVSAHAKDIWTSSEWDLQDKLRDARGTVTCTRVGFDRLAELAAEPEKVHLSYHGLDLARFPRFEAERSRRDGSQRQAPVKILSVGRAVPKKGYDVLLIALSWLPPDLSWRLVHVGGGPEAKRLKLLAGELGISDRISWKGAMDQKDVLKEYQNGDLFALACRVTEDGDRDGLPNVMVEAASQRLPVVSTRVSGISELFVDGENGLLTEPDDPAALAVALERAIRDPDLRRRLADAAEKKVRSDFDHHTSITDLTRLFDNDWKEEHRHDDAA